MVPRSQFHQHFLSCFFVQKHKFTTLAPDVQVSFILAQKLGGKVALKMLVKLTPAVKFNKHNYLSPQMIADTHFYDGANLIGNLGGSLYLFLAISIAHIIVVLRMGGKQLMNKKHL
jgi:hypothetical protein